MFFTYLYKSAHVYDHEKFAASLSINILNPTQINIPKTK